MLFYLSCYILLAIVLLWLLWPRKEGYFTFYGGMPHIPKTYISTTYIRNPDENSGGQFCSVP